jgi:hypothetical protein
MVMSGTRTKFTRGVATQYWENQNKSSLSSRSDETFCGYATTFEHHPRFYQYPVANATLILNRMVISGTGTKFTGA